MTQDWSTARLLAEFAPGVTIAISAIDAIVDLGDDTTRVVLPSGEFVDVGLPYAAFMARLREVLDGTL